MNPEIKQQWIAALRSGEYKQGRNRLRTGEKYFCCLGVLCDIYCKSRNDASFSGDAAVPSDEIRHWSGMAVSLSYSVPGLRDKSGLSTTLPELNDWLNLTFDQIADVIQYFY